MSKKNPQPKVISSSDARIEGQLQVEDCLVVDPSQLGTGEPVIITADADAIVVNGSEVPVLDGDGKLSPAALPSLGIIAVEFVENQEALLDLENVQLGTLVVVEAEDNALYFFNGGTTGSIADWTPISIAAVSSVAGKTGVITLELSDIDDWDAADYAAASHSHAISDVTNLQTTLDGKASASHSHAISDVTGLSEALGSGGGGSSEITSVNGLDNTLNRIYDVFQDLGYQNPDTTPSGTFSLGYFSQDGIYSIESGLFTLKHTFGETLPVLDASFADISLSTGYVIYKNQSGASTSYDLYSISNNGVDPSTETLVTQIDPATDIPLWGSVSGSNIYTKFSAAISPDGSTLFVRVDNTPFPDGTLDWELDVGIWAIDISTGSISNLTSFTDTLTLNTADEYDLLKQGKAIAVSPDSSKITFVVGRSVYEHDGTTLTEVFTLPVPSGDVAYGWPSSNQYNCAFYSFDGDKICIQYSGVDITVDSQVSLTAIATDGVDEATISGPTHPPVYDYNDVYSFGAEPLFAFREFEWGTEVIFSRNVYGADTVLQIRSLEWTRINLPHIAAITDSGDSTFYTSDGELMSASFWSAHHAIFD